MSNTLSVKINAQDVGFKDTLDKLKQSAKQFGEVTQGSGQKAMTLTRAFREAKQAAENLSFAYDQLDDVAKNSDVGKNLKAQMQEALDLAGRLKDIKADTQQEITNIASDTQVWSGVSQGIGVVSSGLQGLASAYGLVGGNCKAFQQALVAVNAIQSISNTVVGIGNALQKQSALMVLLRTVKTKLLTAATIEQTSAQAANNAMCLANPYVAVAAVVVGLAAAIIAWTAATEKATESEKGIQEATKASKDATLSGYEAYKKNEIELQQLKRTVDNFRGSKEQEKQLVNELNSKYGNALGKYKDLNAWKKALANTSYYYCKVLQAEAKLQALNAEASSAWVKAMAGEDVEKNMAKYKKLQEFANAALEDVMFYKDQLRISQNLAGAGTGTSEHKSGSGKSSNRSSNRSSSKTNTTKSDKPDYEKDTNEWYTNEIKKRQAMLDKQNLSLSEQERILKEIVELETKQNNLKDTQKQMKTAIQNRANGTLTEALKPSIATLQLNPEISEEKLQSSIAKLQTDLEKLHPTVTIKTNTEKLQEGLQKSSFLLDQFGQAASSLASITDDEGVAVAGIIAQAVAQIALGAAKATAEASSLGPWAWIAFGATAMAQMIAMIASIHSSTGYADGGIVQGSTTVGDKIITRLNAGEMVLNRRQQANLFNMLDHNTASRNNAVVGGTVKVKGSDLYIALSNYNKIKTSSKNKMNF